MMTETWPCAGGCGTPLTYVPDGKQHFCDSCEDAAVARAAAFWVTVGVDPATVLVPKKAALRAVIGDEVWTGKRQKGNP